MRAGAALILTSLLAASSSWAGNDDEILVGNEAAVMGGAVTAIVSDGSSVWYNPAGLAGVPVDTLNVSGSAFVLRRHRVPRLLSSASGESVQGDVLEIVSVPSALTYVRPLSPTVRVGLGVFVTQASDLSLDTTLDIARVSEDLPRPARVLLALEYSAQTYHAGVSVGWRVSPDIWVGASLMGTLEQIEGSTLYTGGTVGADTGPNGLFNQSDLLESLTIGTLVNAGLQWQLTPRLRLGLSVQSPSIALYNSFSAPNVRSGVVTTDEASIFAFAAGRVEESRVRFEDYLPARVRAGLAYTRGDLVVVIDGDLRPAVSGVRRLNLNARLGAHYAFSETISGGAGLFTDRSPALRTDTFGARDIDFYGGTVGIDYVTSLPLARREGAGEVTFSTTVALRYAYGRGHIGGLTVPTTSDDLVSLNSSPTDLSTHEIGLHLGSSVFF